MTIRHANLLDLIVGAVLGIDVLLVVIAESLLLGIVGARPLLLRLLGVVGEASLADAVSVTHRLLHMGCEVVVAVPQELIVALLELGGFVKANISSN